jgi:O-antigen/teichoic acid export membrane protein
MNEEYCKHTRGVLYTALYVVPLNLKGLVLIPVLTKTLDLEIYGAFVIVQTIISLLLGILNAGLESSLSRFLPVKKGTVEGAGIFYSIFCTSLAANLAVFLLFLGFCDKVGALLGVSRTAAILIGGIIALGSIFGIALEYFRATERFGLFNLIAGARTYLEIFIVTLAAIVLRNLDAIFASMLIVVCFFALGTVLWVLGEIGKPEAINFHVGPYLKYSIPLIPNTISDWVINLSDRFLIGVMLGSFAVGLYNPGYALGSVILFVPTIFVTVLPPLIARLHDTGNMDTLNEIIRHTMKYFLLIAIPVFFGSLVLSKPLLTLLSKREVADQGYLITPIVVFGAILFGCARVLVPVLQANLETRLIAKAWVVAGFVNLTLNLLLLKSLGIVAAALSTAMAFGVAFVMIKK